MSNKLIGSLFERADVDKEDSDFSYFFALLLSGEALAKTIILGLIAAIDNDVNGNRYRLEHKLVRANGLGDWSEAVNDLLSGPASQYLIADVQQECRELTENCNRETWQYRSVSSLKSALDALGIEADELPARSDMKRWFTLLATLRNKTRGHGATRPGAVGQASIHLRNSLDLLYQNLHLFQRPWVYLVQEPFRKISCYVDHIADRRLRSPQAGNSSFAVEWSIHSYRCSEARAVIGERPGVKRFFSSQWQLQ